MNGYNIQILYEDKELLVVQKPSGIAVAHARACQMDLVSYLRNLLASRGEKAEIFTVHRLDTNVAGVLVFAKTKKAAASLSCQVQDGTMDKIYEAHVSGTIPENEDTLINYLVKDARTNLSRVVKDPKAPGAKRAELSYIKTGPDTLRIHLKTGRHHQIRVQLSHAGMPILGDVKYGGPRAEMLGLSAVELSFIHPTSGERMCFHLPEDDS